MLVVGIHGLHELFAFYFILIYYPLLLFHCLGTIAPFCFIIMH
uniref:Uncharacterized protein n=1 Tax=Arundo donax TaxID=35708 RepID=A0A0A9AWW2_ARUDO